MMSLRDPHAPPRTSTETGARRCGRVPDKSEIHIDPCAKYPSRAPSGDQNGVCAPSELGSAPAEDVVTDRTQRRRPMESEPEKRTVRPSGDSAASMNTSLNATP